MNIKVSEVVAAFLDEENLGAAEYAKAYQIAIRGWRDLNWDIVGKNKICPVTLGSDYTIVIPKNCSKVIEFGIGNGNGEIAAFDKVDHLIPQDINDEYTPSLSPLIGLDNNYVYVPQPSLGVGSNNSIGRYTIDMSSRRIFVQPGCAGGDFYIRGLFTGEAGDYEINEMASEALIAYIRWKFNLTGKGKNISTVNFYKSEYYREKGNAKLRIKKPTTQEMNKSSRESTKMAIRS